MAVTLKGQTAVYEGTSTDTKPTDADNNSIFKELDTGIRYYYDGTDWNEIPSSGGGGGGGTGTDNYNDLNNKPSINGTTLSGNKSLDNLGIQAKLTFDSTPTEDSENPVESGGVYSALAGKQDAISDLSTIRRGAAAGATAVQPATLETALAGKQDALSSEQLDAVNSGITSADVEQITTNKNNISTDRAALVELVDGGAKNLLKIMASSQTIKGVTFTVNDDQTVTVNGTNNGTGPATFIIVSNAQATTIPDGKYILSGCPAGGGISYDLRWYLYSPGKSAYDVGAGSLVEKSGNTTDSNIAIVVKEGRTANNLVFKPMICSKADWDISQSYQPYAPSNAELYAMIQALQTQLSNQ